MWIPSTLFLQRMANAMIDPLGSGASFGPLGNTWLGLYIQPTPVLNYASTMANITESTFGGYARIEAVWDQPYFGSGLLEYLEAQAMHWRSTDSVTPQVIKGLFFADALTVGNLLLSLPLPNQGVPMGVTGQSMTVLPRFALDSQGNWGDYTLLN